MTKKDEATDKLREALTAGEASGVAEGFSFDRFVAERTTTNKPLDFDEAATLEVLRQAIVGQGHDEAEARKRMSARIEAARTGLTPEQRAIVADRLDRPFEFAAQESMAALHRKY